MLLVVECSELPKVWRFGACTHDPSVGKRIQDAVQYLLDGFRDSRASESQDISMASREEIHAHKISDLPANSVEGKQVDC